jgi:hypothetical protein
VEVRHQDVIEFLREPLARDDNLVLASYLLSELRPERRRMLRRALREAYGHAPCTIAIVESDQSCRRITVENLHDPPELLSYEGMALDLSFLDRLRLGEKPKFSESEFRRLLSAYFAAWRAHDSGLIADIFSSDAIYEIHGRSTLEGLGEISKYWSRNAAVQSDVEYEIIWAVEAGDGIIAEWRAAFEESYQQGYSEHRSLRGMLRLYIEHGKIVRLTEVYVDDKKRGSVNSLKELQSADG